MKISDQIRMLCARINISQAELARRIGQSPQNLNAKIKRESLSDNELELIANVLGVQFKRNFIFPEDMGILKI